MNSYEELTKYVGRLYDAAYRKTCDALQAEELTQETLLRRRSDIVARIRSGQAVELASHRAVQQAQ